MNNERIDNFIMGLRDDGRLAQRTGDMVEAALTLMRQLLPAVDKYRDLTLASDEGATEREVSSALDSLSAIFAQTAEPNLPLLQWVKEWANRLSEKIGQIPGLWLASLEDRARELRDLTFDFARLRDEVTGYLDTEALMSRARLALEQTESARDAAQEAAGTTGATSLAEHFTVYARGERVAANWFRAFTILAVVAGVLIAILFGPIHEGDWTALVFRVALVAGAGALAAYFGRQAGQHRRLYNWAKSLEVQLKSFPAFIQPLSDEERADAYRTFSRRVLAAPPEKGESSEDSVGAAQLLDLVAILAKRAQ